LEDLLREVDTGTISSPLAVNINIKLYRRLLQPELRVLERITDEYLSAFEAQVKDQAHHFLEKNMQIFNAETRELAFEAFRDRIRACFSKVTDYKEAIFQSQQSIIHPQSEKEPQYAKYIIERKISENSKTVITNLYKLVDSTITTLINLLPRHGHALPY